MKPKESILYLLQVSLPFILLGSFKNSYFFLPVVVIACALPFETLRSRLIKFWQKLGMFLSKIISPVILSIIYFLGLTPLAFIKRMFSQDTFVTSPPPESNFKTISHQTKIDDFDNLW